MKLTEPRKRVLNRKKSAAMAKLGHILLDKADGQPSMGKRICLVTGGCLIIGAATALGGESILDAIIAGLSALL